MSSSDDEETTAVVPREVRSARRGAAVALAASGLVCLCSVATLIQTEGQPAQDVGRTAAASALFAQQQDPTAASTEELIDSVSGALSQMRQVEFGLGPAPYHLTQQCELRASPSRGAEIVDEMPAEVQVFPIKEQGDWVQVIVSSAEMKATSLSANYGWLPKKEHGSRLLEKDTEVRHKVRSTSKGENITQEKLDAKWAEVRSKNNNLKAQLAQLQNAMKDSYAERVRTEKQKAGRAATAAVSEIINVNEVSKTVSNLGKELKKPDTLLDKLEHEFLK